MDRYYKSGAAVAPPSATDNTSYGYPTAGDPGSGAPAAKPGPYGWHMIIEEIMSVIAAAGVTPDKTDVGQMLKALKKMGLMGGLSGGGIGQFQFPASQNPSADANTLDDYEEGTWTGVLGGDVSESGQSYATRECKYVKIGSLVVAQFKLALSAKGTITGNLALKGLPFALSLNNDVTVAISWANFTTALASCFLNVSSSTYGLIRGSGVASTGPNALAGSDISNTAAITGVIAYVVSF